MSIPISQPALPQDVASPEPPPLSLPRSPSPVHTHRATRSVHLEGVEQLPESLVANTRAFRDNSTRPSPNPETRRRVPLPHADLANGASVQESPSSAVRIHALKPPYLIEPYSVPIENHPSLLSSLQSGSASYQDPPQHAATAEQTHPRPPLLSPFSGSNQWQSSYSGGNDMERGQEEKESQHNQVKSLEPDTQYQGGAYRHVSLPIIEPKAQTESYEPLQYHHQALENPTRPVDKRASKLTIGSSTSDSSANYDSQTRHDRLIPSDWRNNSYGNQVGRPDSGFSSISDLRARARSPQLSPNSYARPTSAHSTGHSPETRPLSYVDLLNVPYPQPPPVTADALHNLTLRNAVGRNASLLSTRQTLEMYRANVKKTNDPAIQYEFAVFMISAAQETVLDIDNLSISDHADKHSIDAKRDLLKEARQILQRLSDRSYPFAQYYLADGYFSGLFNKGKGDYDKAFPLFIAAAKHGHAEAGYRGALCYEFGWGCRMDGAKAVQFYRQAASKNHPGAMLRLAKACLTGDMGLGKRYREGVKWLKRAAESADFQYNSAPYELGLLHETGFGDDIFRDESYTAQLFTKSADLGHAEASYRLGDAYEHGKLNCPRDPALAVHFYTGAAERDHPLAQMALCAWYMVGAEPVLQKDEDEAYQWALKAAESGLTKAEYAIGYFSEMGIGCRKDALAANHWYSKAAQHGDQRAVHRMAAINAASTGADPVTAALPVGKSRVLKPGESSANIGPGKFVVKDAATMG
jgi:TPR repeat protein